MDFQEFWVLIVEFAIASAVMSEYPDPEYIIIFWVPAPVGHFGPSFQVGTFLPWQCIHRFLS